MNGGYVYDGIEDVGRPRNIDLELQIEASIGVGNRLPEMAIQKLELNKTSIILFRRPTEIREGSAEHIILDHEKEIDSHYIRCIENAIKEPLDVIKVKSERIALKSFFGKNKKGNDIYFVVIIEKQPNDDVYEIVTAYPTKKI